MLKVGEDILRGRGNGFVIVGLIVFKKSWLVAEKNREIGEDVLHGSGTCYVVVGI
ncbi:hypothetical protein GFH33_31955 (plasmid) [Bacillus thuringiensis]|uniref:hypothetical protein n=1 Tax=Bacillus thuringiensis TaxID=1428 RepID=UPI001F1BAD1B|nr:hypothetical protein [Bacillus thuringiensis]UJT50304.1 hypothetical protein GFH33_31955 [Bacillus thuringiensis]